MSFTLVLHLHVYSYNIPSVAYLSNDMRIDYGSYLNSVVCTTSVLAKGYVCSVLISDLTIGSYIKIFTTSTPTVEHCIDITVYTVINLMQ